MHAIVTYNSTMKAFNFHFPEFGFKIHFSSGKLQEIHLRMGMGATGTDPVRVGVAHVMLT